MQSRDAATLQEAIISALRKEGDLRKLPDDWLSQSVVFSKADASALSQAVHAVYAKQVYAFEKDLALTERDQQVLSELRRALQISPEDANEIRTKVGINLFRRIFRESISDGCYTSDENDLLNRTRKYFMLRKSETNQAVKDLALSHYAFMLAEAAKDQLISDTEMANLSAFSKQFGLSKGKLRSLSVPDAESILRSALNDIKSKGVVDTNDYDHIRRLASILNADNLLKPCLQDLELFEQIFRLRSGELPKIKMETLVLQPGEHLHYFTPVSYEGVSGKRKTSIAGDLYVGSMRIRFVSSRRSHEIRYANLLEVQAIIPKTTKPQLQMSVSSGSGTGSYRLKRKDPALTIELVEAIRFLVRKARGFEKAPGRDTSYVSAEVRSEVWYRDDGKCVMCDATDYLEFDHIIPRSKGGATSVNNLQLLCRRCNSQKSDRI